MAIATVTLICNIALTAGSNPSSFPGGNITVTKPTRSQAEAEVLAVAQARIAGNEAANVVLNEFVSG